MGRQRIFRNSIYSPAGLEALSYFEKFSKEELNIQNFIYPAILNGLVRNVYFFFPEWRKFKSARTTIQVGSVFGEGKIIKYPTWLNRNAHQAAVDKALPDLKKFSFLSRPIDQMPRKRQVILDIDLDYFACRDSVQNNWEYRLEITSEQYRRKEAFLKDKTIRFSGLEFTFKKNKRQPVVIIAFRKIPEKAYKPDFDEIRKNLDILIRTLSERAIRPAVITLCRSRISGYCPAEYVRFIEDDLEKKLAKIYSLRINEKTPFLGTNF